MVELAELQALAFISQIVGVVGTLTAAFIAVRSYINANKRAEESRKRDLETRQAQLYMQLLSQFNTPERQKAWATLMSYEWKDPEDFVNRIWSDIEKKTQIMYFSWLLEGIGILVYNKLISIRMVDDLMSSVVISYWQKYRDVELYCRMKFNNPANAEWFEYRYNEISSVAFKQHPEFASKDVM